MMMLMLIGSLRLDWSWLESSPGVGLWWGRLLDSRCAKERLGDGVTAQSWRGVGGGQARRGLRHHGRRVVPAGPVGDDWSEAGPGLVRQVVAGRGGSQG